MFKYISSPPPIDKYQERIGPIALCESQSRRRTTLNTKLEEDRLGTLWHAGQQFSIFGPYKKCGWFDRIIGHYNQVICAGIRFPRCQNQPKKRYISTTLKNRTKNCVTYTHFPTSHRSNQAHPTIN